jgi:hypothetical protein
MVSDPDPIFDVSVIDDKNVASDTSEVREINRCSTSPESRAAMEI